MESCLRHSSVSLCALVCEDCVRNVEAWVFDPWAPDLRLNIPNLGLASGAVIDSHGILLTKLPEAVNGSMNHRTNNSR